MRNFFLRQVARAITTNSALQLPRAYSQKHARKPIFVIFDIHEEQIKREGIYHKTAQAMTHFKEMGVRSVLFESSESVNPRDIERKSQQHSEELWAYLQSSVGLFTKIINDYNAKHGTNYKITREDGIKVVENMPFVERCNSLRKAMPRSSEQDIASLAYLICGISTDHGLLTLATAAAKEFGQDHCIAADIAIDPKIDGMPNTAYNMTRRDGAITSAIIVRANEGGVLGIFGVGHCEGMNPQRQPGIRGMLKFAIEAQKNPHDPNYQQSLGRYAAIDPRDLILVYPYIGPAMDDSTLELRQKLLSEQEKDGRKAPEDKDVVPVYIMDATNLSPEEFADRLEKLWQEHQKRYPTKDDKSSGISKPKAEALSGTVKGHELP